MQRNPIDPTIQCTETNEIWQLTRQGRVLAIIERAWDDQHWLLFRSDAADEPLCSGAYRRTATLKAVLRLWARRLPPDWAHLKGSAAMIAIGELKAAS